MRDEVISLGFKELLTPDDVDSEITKSGKTLVFVNSVCGCAAGKARPGLKLAVEYLKNNSILPDNMLTVFAGMEIEAVRKTRDYFGKFPPSSPQIALVKDGKLVDLIQRHQIENSDEFKVADMVINLFKNLH
ncbi:MAG: BrxA/BrxB family bacilliredoxin [Ignavibacteria bacterium]|jgi:putative YphP/YqiW family bacilliredoxin|nr:BrxA/BrxB family bacilliredoxin [Ignavibacteria bacterium]